MTNNNNEELVLLARIDERTKAMADRLEEHLENDEQVHADHEERIRVGEKWRNRLIGLIAAGAGGSGGLAAWLNGKLPF